VFECLNGVFEVVWDESSITAIRYFYFYKNYDRNIFWISGAKFQVCCVSMNAKNLKTSLPWGYFVSFHFSFRFFLLFVLFYFLSFFHHSEDGSLLGWCVMCSSGSLLAFQRFLLPLLSQH
jgi:hypothetical protein